MKNKISGTTILVCLICVLLFILVVNSGMYAYSKLQFESETMTDYKIETINYNMKDFIFHMNFFTKNAGNNILFSSELSSLKNTVNSVDNETRNNSLINLQNDLLAFLKETKDYSKIRYIDEHGDEVVTVEFCGKDYHVLSEEELQNKKNRYFFDEAMSLEKGEVYISPLDLNFKYGELENRGDDENPEYVPVIRFATPVFNDNGEAKGIIISNVYADHFLNDVRNLQREGQEVFLINHDGYYLAHPNRSKEYSFLLESNDTFYSDYKGVNKETLMDHHVRSIDFEDSIISFLHITPTAASFEISEGSKKIYGEQSHQTYCWIILAVVDKEVIDKPLDKLNDEYLYSLMFSGLIVSILIFLVLLLAYKKNI